MKKRIIPIAIISFMFFFISGASQAEEYYIGVSLPLSGKAGLAMRYGLEMFAEELNEQGGVNGKKIKLLINQS